MNVSEVLMFPSVASLDLNLIRLLESLNTSYPKHTLATDSLLKFTACMTELLHRLVKM